MRSAAFFHSHEKDGLVPLAADRLQVRFHYAGKCIQMLFGIALGTRQEVAFLHAQGLPEARLGHLAQPIKLDQADARRALRTRGSRQDGNRQPASL